MTSSTVAVNEYSFQSPMSVKQTTAYRKGSFQNTMTHSLIVGSTSTSSSSSSSLHLFEKKAMEEKRVHPSANEEERLLCKEGTTIFIGEGIIYTILLLDLSVSMLASKPSSPSKVSMRMQTLSS